MAKTVHLQPRRIAVPNYVSPTLASCFYVLRPVKQNLLLWMCAWTVLEGSERPPGAVW